MKAQAGAYWPVSSDFPSTFGKTVVFVPQLSFGCPVSAQMLIFSKLGYLASEGTITYAVVNFSGPPFPTIGTTTGTTKIEQWMVNLGVQLVLPVAQLNSIGLSLGPLLTSVKEERPSTMFLDASKEVSTYYTQNQFSILGYFIGATLETNIPGSSLSIILEGEFDYAYRTDASFLTNYGGASVGLGVRSKLW
jgi:hypothetical protein